MGGCSYRGLTGIIIDSIPDGGFITNLSTENLLKITKHFCKKEYGIEPEEGVATAFWGLDYLDNSLSVDIKDGMQITLKFKRVNGIFAPSYELCDHSIADENNLSEDDLRKAAMREVLVQSEPFLPKDRKHHYFMLTHFESGCCKFAGGKINAKLEEIKKLI